MIVIRQETAKDFEAVHWLVKEAFAGAEQSDGNEQDLVAALRKSEAFVPELSLVAEIDGAIAGHILFTEAKVGSDAVLVLAPLAVVHEQRNKGVGGALITAGHGIAEKLGYAYSLVLGSETYYPRFGYLCAELFGMEVPVGMPARNFMAVPLQDDAKPVSGMVKYAKEFALQETGKKSKSV